MTMRYSHVTMDMQRDATARLDELLGKPDDRSEQPA